MRNSSVFYIAKCHTLPACPRIIGRSMELHFLTAYTTTMSYIQLPLHCCLQEYLCICRYSDYRLKLHWLIITNLAPLGEGGIYDTCHNNPYHNLGVGWLRLLLFSRGSSITVIGV